MRTACLSVLLLGVGLAKAECNPKPIEELQYMGAVALTFEHCTAAGMHKILSESSDDASGKGLHGLALRFARQAEECVSYAVTIGRVLQKDHKIDAHSEFQRAMAAGSAACLEEAKSRGRFGKAATKQRPK